MLRYLRAVMMHFSFNKNIGFCGRPEDDELVTSSDLHFRAACACLITASTVWKRHRSFLSWKQPIVETRAERGGERRVCARKLPPIFAVVDRFATGTNIGY